MSKYTLEVEIDSDTGELILPIPDKLLAEMGWDLGDELVREEPLICEDTGEYPGYTLTKKIKD